MSIDFNKVVTAKSHYGGGPQPTMSYLRRPSGKGKHGYCVALIKSDRDKVIKRYGNKVGIGYLPNTRQIVIASPESGLAVRTISIQKKGDPVGVISATLMNNVAKRYYGDHQHVYFDMTWDEDGFILTPNGKTKD